MSARPELDAVLARPVLEVAPALLGAVLRHVTDDGAVAVRLTEVEAYDGANDPGSHAWRGPTPRNQVMFGPAGVLYTYRIYGMHVCANVVTGRPGVAAAVLLRAGEIIEGHALAQARRGEAVPFRDLARGPGRLCRALGLDMSAYGTPADLSLGPADQGVICSGPRVGLRRAAQRPWRFWLDGEPTVSPYRPAKPR